MVGELHRDLRELLVGLIEGGERRRRGLHGSRGSGNHGGGTHGGRRRLCRRERQRPGQGAAGGLGETLWGVGSSGGRPEGRRHYQVRARRPWRWRAAPLAQGARALALALEEEEANLSLAS